MAFEPLGNDEDRILDLGKKLLDQAFTGWKDVYDGAEADALMLDGSDGKQWDSTARAARDKTKRPYLTANILERHVGQVTGAARQAPIAIKVRPDGEDGDVETAEQLERIIRAIQYESVARQAFNIAIENAAAHRMGYFRLRTDYEEETSFNQVIRIEPIYDSWSVRIDPKSSRHDLADADYLYIFERQPVDEFKAEYPNQPVPTTFASVEGSQWYEGDMNGGLATITKAEFWWREKHDTTLYLLGDGRSLTEAQLAKEEVYEKESAQGPQRVVLLNPAQYALGAMPEYIPIVDKRRTTTTRIRMALLTGSGLLQKPTDWPCSHFPLFPVYGRTRYYRGRRVVKGILSDLHDTQRLLNYVFTSAAEKLASDVKAKWLADEQTISKYEDQWKRANDPTVTTLLYKSNPSLVNGGRPERLQGAEPPVAELTMLAHLKELFKDVTGQYDAMLGAKSNEVSGVAIQSRQRQSEAITEVFHDNRELAVEHCGRVILELIPKIYDTQRYVPTLKEDLETFEPVGINGAPNVYGTEQEPRSYDLTKGKYACRVTVGPAYATRRMESQAVLERLLQAIPPEMAARLAPAMVRNIDAPGMQDAAEVMQQVVDGGDQNMMVQLLGQFVQSDEFKAAVVATLQEATQAPE